MNQIVTLWCLGIGEIGDFLSKCNAAIRSAIIYGLAVKRHGLTETNRRVDVINEQSRFWYSLVKELHGELRKADEAGDLTGFVVLEHQFRSALRRFEEEVARPMENLHR